jgi:glycosyltransferase involved in cell wall biosynthesis
MNNKTILFVSTVREWGGSEVLWAETALLLADRGYRVKFATRYNGAIVERLKRKGASYIYIGVISKMERVLRKVKLKRDPFLRALLIDKPEWVVISTGSNTDARPYMNHCRQFNTRFVTIIHLVTNILWAFIDDKTIDELRAGFAKAAINYFVSKANREMHDLMIGDRHPNCKTLVNPFRVPVDVPDNYPPLINGQYQIALVGRIELFHKGHDILIQLLGEPKWKDRPITFNLYGTGPHLELLKRLLVKYDVKNVVLKGYVQGIAEVWKSNHFLVLPSRMEGQSLALLEAMWCYRGAVVTDVGGASELITDGETGFISPYPTVSHFEAALDKAWLMHDRWEEIGRKAGERIREIYSENSVEEFAHELEKVLN